MKKKSDIISEHYFFQRLSTENVEVLLKREEAAMLHRTNSGSTL